VSSSQGRNKVQRRRNDGATTSNMKQSNISQVRKPRSCGVCKDEGHNHTSCPVLSQQIESETEGDNEYDDELEGTVDMVSQY
jgi:hypothetical protein